MPLDDTAPNASRRTLLRGAGLGAAALGAMAAGSALPNSAHAAGVTDADVLNFALNLEYLEAEFYLRATTGKGLPSSSIGGHGQGGVVTGGEGQAVPFTNNAVREIAADITSDEVAHVNFLRAALGDAKVGRPRIDFHSSFTTLARAAGIVGPTGSFSPFSNDNSFLLAAYIFEDVGVTAYHGGARYITNKDYLSAAAGILGTEAYHAGVIRLAILRSSNSDLIAAAGKVSKLRATLAGANDDSGPVVQQGQYNLVPSDANSVTFERSPGQVLNIVYGNTNAAPGLFFPNGMNGTIH